MNKLYHLKVNMSTIFVVHSLQLQMYTFSPLYYVVPFQVTCLKAETDLQLF